MGRQPAMAKSPVQTTRLAEARFCDDWNQHYAGQRSIQSHVGAPSKEATVVERSRTELNVLSIPLAAQAAARPFTGTT